MGGDSQPTVSLNVKVTPELMARILRECTRRGMKKPAVVRRAIEAWLEDAISSERL